MNGQVLRRLTGKRSFHYAVFDIEAMEWIKFKMLGFFDGEEFIVFRKIDDFLDHFLQRKYANWRCFAHFGGGYDFNFLLEPLSKRGFHFDILSSNGASMIRIRDSKNKSRSWYLIDSFRLLPLSLEVLTKSFDVKHKKLKIDFAHDLDKAEALVYLEHDCKGLYEVLQKFEGWFKSYNVPLKPTTASQAMALYRKMMPMDIPLLTETEEKFVREGYYGGRTEVFKMYCEKHLYYYDVRSLYPYVMKNFPMPVGKPHAVNSFIKDRIGFYRASLKVPDMYFPPLPVVIRQKLMFPIGKFSGTYSSAELETAMELGCEVTIKDGYVFPDAFIFNEYVDEMYERKEHGDNAMRAIPKLMLNGLYGKFGQNRLKTSIFRAKNSQESIGYIPYNDEYALYQKESISRATFIIPSISAWITSNARMVLLKLLHQAGEKHAYYCDTDSVLSTRPLPIGEKLGDLKLELEGNKAVFLSPKTYAIETATEVIKKAKGFENDVVKNFTFNDYMKALHGDKSSFVQDVMRVAKFKEGLRREGKFLCMINKKKSIRSDYDKRIVDSNFDTLPQKVSL